MASKFPGALDALPTDKTNRTHAITGAADPDYDGPEPTGAGDHAANHNEANSAINAVQATLGTDPQGGSATVKARIAAVEASVASKQDAATAATDSELSAEANARVEGDEALADSLTEALAALAAARAASAMGFVNHGSDAEAARPTGYASVTWKGTVEPSNADPADDIWIEI